ncbi:Elongator complex protein 6, partial [Globisporangium splendens]
MAEALYYLSESLAWAPTSAPRGELVLISDAVESSGAFLVHHFVALFLKAGHRVCFLNFANSKAHYAAVGRKLVRCNSFAFDNDGVNFASMEAANTLRVMDGFSAAVAPPFTSLLDLFHATARFAKESQQQEDKRQTPVSIVIDDLSSLKWQFGADKVLAFVRCCKTLTHAENGRVNVVVLSHADTDSSSFSPSPLTSRSLNAALLDMSSVVFSVAPLPSGYSKDVHGTLTVQQQSSGLEGLRAPAAISYKILENTIRCFRSGGDALRSI